MQDQEYATGQRTARRMRMTMSWHLTPTGAREARDHLDRTVRRVATNGTYHVERWLFLWRVVKRWTYRVGP
jgi:hypothetical protein